MCTDTRRCSRIAATVAAVLMLAAAAGAQNTAFTFQGSLKNGSALAEGSYDFQFSLYNAASGPSLQGSTITQTGVTVTKGLFTVSLDFGDQFPGAARWLEIAAKASADASYTTLSPRQELTATPYAIRAANAGSLALPFNASLATPGPLMTLLNSTSSNNASLAGMNFGIAGACATPIGAGVGGGANTGMGVAGTSITGMGVYGATMDANSLSFGVHGQSLSTPATSAGVEAQGNGAAGPGVPRAAALRINTGAITVAGPINQRPAGTIPVMGQWFPMETCVRNGHTHWFGWFIDVPLQNDLIVAGPPNVGSVILATVETANFLPIDYSYFVQVWNKTPGNLIFRVSRMGALDPTGCPPPSEINYIHYEIINPQ